MATDSDDVRNYIAGLEDDRRVLAEVRAMIDVFRRNVLPDSSVTNRMETDAEVIARLGGAPEAMHAELAGALGYDPCVKWRSLLHVATSTKAIADFRGARSEEDSEAQSKDLADLRAVLDRYRKGVSWHDTNVAHRDETDAEVAARLAVEREKAVRAYDEASTRSFTEGRNEGIRLGLRAASLLASDHDCGDEHDARLDALATKILGTSAEGAKSMVEAYDRLQQGGSYHLAPGTTGPAVVGDSVYDHLGREVGRVADPANIYAYKLTEVSAFGVETPPSDKPFAWSGPTVEGGMGGARPSAIPSKPCPMKDCDLPCDDGHKHIVEKTDEPRSPEVTTIPGKKPIRLRAGQIWRAKDGYEYVVTVSPALGTADYYLGSSRMMIGPDFTVTDTGGCTLVYDPRGDK